MLVQDVESKVENWLNQFADSSRRPYRMGLTTFIDFLQETTNENWTPEKIIEERIKDLDKRTFLFEQKLIDFFKWLQDYVTKPSMVPFEKTMPSGKKVSGEMLRKGGKNLSDNTKQSYIVGVRSFLSYNRLDLNLTTQQKRIIGKKSKLIHQDYRLSLTDLEKMAEVGNPQERFILLAGKDLGLRAIDFMNLTQGVFARVIEQNKDAEAPYFMGEVYTQKEGVTAYPFLTVDGLEASRIWLKVLETKELRNDKEPMLQIHKKELTANLKRMAKKAGIETHGQRIRFHCLRKFLADKLSLKMSESKWKQIIGKQIDEGAYVSSLNLKEGYASVLDYIQIHKRPGLDNKHVEKLKEELRLMVTTLSKQNLDIEKENKNLKEQVASMTDNNKKTEKELISLSKRLREIEEALKTTNWEKNL